jgi:hypothetical protein
MLDMTRPRSRHFVRTSLQPQHAIAVQHVMPLIEGARDLRSTDQAHEPGLGPLARS